MSLRLRTFIGQLLASSIVLVSLFALLFSMHSAYAQSQPEAVTLGVSPQILDITANPGEEQVNTFRLTNASAEVVSLNTTPKNFTPRGEEGAVDLTEDKTSYSMAEWISVAPETGVLQPGQTQDFVVTISVPDNAEPGSHFGSVVFSTVPPEQEGSAALVSQEIAPVILVKIAGDTTESAEIVEFSSDKGIYDGNTPINLSARVENTGNVHFKPKGKIVIKNMWGSQAVEKDIDRRNVLPDSIRQISTEFEPGSLSIGRYTASLSIVYGDTDEIVVAETTFIVFPFRVVLPVLAVLIIVILLIIKFRKRISLALKVLSGKDESTKPKSDE